MNTTFLDACYKKKTSHTPVWYMRQAGRYLPEYRKLKEKYTILEICQTPELATQVALQPVNLLGVDAAILFADIMIPLLGSGIDLDIVENIGPVIKTPIQTLADVKKINKLNPEQDIPYLLQTIKLLRKELNNTVPLIGFSAAPFTLASYLIEGKPTRDFIKTKSFMYSNRPAWEQLMEKLTEMIIVYLHSQIKAGAQAIQIFDSWVGYLSPADFKEYVLPYSKRVFEAISNRHPGKPKAHPGSLSAETFRDSGQARMTGSPELIPTIHFGTNMAGFLTDFASVDCDVVSIDWRMNLSDAWQTIGPTKAIQGNLDPVLLLNDFSVIKKQVDAIFKSLPKREGYIFNLGHGVLPGTQVENIKRLTAYVHEKK